MAQEDLGGLLAETQSQWASGGMTILQMAPTILPVLQNQAHIPGIRGAYKWQGYLVLEG